MIICLWWGGKVGSNVNKQLTFSVGSWQLQYPAERDRCHRPQRAQFFKDHYSMYYFFRIPFMVVLVRRGGAVMDFRSMRYGQLRSLWIRFLLQAKKVIRMSAESLFTCCMLDGCRHLVGSHGAQAHHGVTEVRANLFGLTSGPPVEFAAETFGDVAITASATIFA